MRSPPLARSKAKMKELSRFFPAISPNDIPYNITPVVKASIEKVLSTLVEAVVLVFIVMFLFLQNIRYTIHSDHCGSGGAARHLRDPAARGVFVNMLTMFGMCWRRHSGGRCHRRGRERRAHHGRGGACPREATRKAMSQITGAIIGITLVLIAVFVPMAFFPGSVGIIYRQFSVTMVAAIGFSALLAMSLTPALARHAEAG